MAAKTLYETDFVEWSDQMAELIKAGRFNELDIPNLAEEVKDLGESVRRSVRSQLQRLLMHKIKQTLQPERDGTSWQNSIDSARDKIVDTLADSGSLKTHLEQSLERVYKLSVRDALRETGKAKTKKNLPETCPWTLDELLAE
jgi:hypothetical protein